MEYIIPRNFIGWNINFNSVYLELLNVLLWKTIEKYQTFSSESDIPGTFKFYYNWNNSSLNFVPKTGSFLRFLPKFAQRAYNFMI